METHMLNKMTLWPEGNAGPVASHMGTHLISPVYATGSKSVLQANPEFQLYLHWVMNLLPKTPLMFHWDTIF